jgi:lipoprotein-anchoring transpeptidase ErfK/SrfK
MEEVMLTRIITALLIAIAAFAFQSLFDLDSKVSANSHQATVEVQPGDTLSAIAERHGISVQVLAEANQIQNPDLIQVGQVLQLPESGNTQGAQATAPGNAPTWESQWLEVDLTNQIFRAREGEQVVYSGVISSGRPSTPTLTGTFETYIHLYSDRMTGWTPHGGSYDLPDVPYVMYYDGDYGVHGTYWHNNFGTPMSAGCVNLTIGDAQWVFNWAGGAGATGLTVYIHGHTPGA